MDERRDTRFVERLRFFDGQQLFAPDLQGIEEFDRSMRELHNRSLHQPGIGNGFAVSGRRGDREVTVQAGYAIDAEGREITLLDTQVEQVPPVSGEPDGGPAAFDLAVSYPSDDDLEEAETREGVCMPRGAVALREKPVFCWVRLRRDASGELRAVDPAQAAALQSGLLIALARVEVLNCRLNADLSVAQRRSARPPQQPVIRCATVAVSWEPWPDVRKPDGQEPPRAIGVTTRVTTAAAGFRTTPCYSARISGTRPLVITLGERDELSLLDLPAYVQNAAPDGFDCYVPIVDLDDGHPDVGVELARLTRALDVLGQDGPWEITWLGIEG